MVGQFDLEHRHLVSLGADLTVELRVTFDVRCCARMSELRAGDKARWGSAILTLGSLVLFVCHCTRTVSLNLDFVVSWSLEKLCLGEGLACDPVHHTISMESALLCHAR